MAVNLIHGEEQLEQGDSKYPYLAIGPLTGLVYLVLSENRRVNIKSGKVWDSNAHSNGECEWERVDKSIVLSNV